MENIRVKYRRILIAIFIIMGIAIGFMYFYTTNKSLQTYQESAEESLIGTKKVFLKDTVNNVILEIEQRQDYRVKVYTHILNDMTNTIELYYQSSSSENFLEDVIKYLQSDDYSRINIKITEKNTEEVLFENFEMIKEDYPVNMSLDYGEYVFLLSVSKAVIDEDVKQQMHEVIHNYKFSENAYIWVNEVVNYQGGENYAIRIIHPNLIDTEGDFLSTNTTDVVGNKPYLMELEGVTQNNEIFFNYFFQKKDSDMISEKITYAKLYEEYDWIIAMGIHLDDVEAYVQETTRQSRENIQEMLVITAFIMMSLIIVVLIFISILEKWYYKNSNIELKEKVYLDSNTGLFNRRAGELHLKDAFSKYKSSGQNSAIMMIDIDNFKSINDLCGHDKGDYVLIQVANTLSKYIRSTDILCRWGGDEFILICQGMKDEDTNPFTIKILNAISELTFECSEDKPKSNVTISIGASTFAEDDPESGSAFKRADKSLYKAKSQGKNIAIIYEENEMTTNRD